MLRIGVDIGGTFTDLVAASDDGIEVHKVPSTPGDPSVAFAEAVGRVHEDPDDDRQAYFAPDPTAIGLRADEMAALGVDEPVEAPLVDVAVRAALGTGAGIRVVPAGQAPTDGRGAILRW